MLWFAWKIVLLQYRKQHAPSPDGRKPCCDLLEKSYFCSIANNHHNLRQIERMVVICLKNRTFAVSQTTFRKGVEKDWSCDLLEKSYFCSIANNGKAQALVRRRLWFAWKIVLLQYRKQPFSKTETEPLSCDLLEKSYFCSIANNTRGMPSSDISVVICLKNRTFAVSQTTLQKRLQWQSSCDLLEKSYFCSIANNTIII